MKYRCKTHGVIEEVTIMYGKRLCEKCVEEMMEKKDQCSIVECADRISEIKDSDEDEFKKRWRESTRAQIKFVMDNVKFVISEHNHLSFDQALHIATCIILQDIQTQLSEIYQITGCSR